jgi:hypothetical protein
MIDDTNLMKERAEQIMEHAKQIPTEDNHEDTDEIDSATPIVIDPILLATLKAEAPLLPAAADAYDLAVRHSIGFEPPEHWPPEPEVDDVTHAEVTPGVEPDKSPCAPANAPIAYGHPDQYDEWTDPDGSKDVGDTCAEARCSKNPTHLVWFKAPSERVGYCHPHAKEWMDDPKAYRKTSL